MRGVGDEYPGHPPSSVLLREVTRKRGVERQDRRIDRSVTVNESVPHGDGVGEFDLDQAVLHGLWDTRRRLTDDFDGARDGKKAHAVGRQGARRGFAGEFAQGLAASAPLSCTDPFTVLGSTTRIFSWAAMSAGTSC